MSTSAAKDPSILVGDVHLTECPNGDCDIRIEKWERTPMVHKNVIDYIVNIPKANRNSIAEFLKV